MVRRRSYHGNESCETHLRGVDLHDGHGIVVEDGWDILRRKLVGGVGDEEAGLADGTVADYDAP